MEPLLDKRRRRRQVRCLRYAEGTTLMKLAGLARRAFCAALLAAAVLAQGAVSSSAQGLQEPVAAPTAAASAAAAPMAELDRAREWLRRLQKRQIDRAQLTPAVDAALNDAVVDAMQRQLGPLGEPTSLTQTSALDNDGTASYTYLVKWSAGALYYTFSVDDASGKIAGLYFRPAPPSGNP